MKNFSDTLEQELVVASRRLSAQTGKAKTRRRRSYGKRPLLVATVIASLGGSAAIAATQPWKPDSLTAAGEQAPAARGAPTAGIRRRPIACRRPRGPLRRLVDQHRRRAYE